MLRGFLKASYFHDLSKVDFTQGQIEVIDKQIRSEPLLIFSKDYCPYCIRAKNTLARGSVSTAKVVEINLADDGLVQQAILFHLTGQKTVPHIFIGGKLIGGSSDLYALEKSGELKKLLDEAGVPNSF